MSEKEPGRSPDWHLTALSKDTERRGRIGAAWNNDDGSISIVLNPFVVLEAQDGTVLRLWPPDWKRPEEKKAAKKGFDPAEDDIPF